MSDNGGTGAPNRLVGRFTLTDLIEERYGCQVWKAVDSTLNREVVLWMAPFSDELLADLQLATRTAATVDDRRIVRILDVFATDEQAVVVTEWAPGAVLRDHLAEPLPAEEAARIAFEVAGAIEAAHTTGIAHGRLRPSNVLIGHDGEVRVTGLGIDAILAGVDPVADGDPVLADVNGIGSILYVGLTGRWPGDPIEGIPGAPQVGGQTPPPRDLRADIPESLDDLCARTVVAVAAPRGRAELASVSQVREVLGASLTDMTGERVPLSAPRPEPVGLSLPGRVAVAAGVLVLLTGVLWFAVRMLGGSPADSALPAASATTSESTRPSASASNSAPQRVDYRIVGASDFDPLGNGEENAERVPLAYDGDKNTAWRTVTYYNKSLDKPGVGVLLDLGAPRAVGQVSLDLVGNGTDLQVLTSDQPGSNPNDYELLAQATEAGEHVTLKNPDPTSARYVLIWMTGLPQVDGGWRGGIREVTVSS